MIKSIRFKNFFSFKDCTVTLNNINALIGINGTGKSNFIKALQLLKATVTEGALPDLILNQWGGFDAMFFAGNDSEGNTIELEFEFDHSVLTNYGFNSNESFFYCITLKKVNSTQNYYISEKLYSTKDNVCYEQANHAESLLCQLVDQDHHIQLFSLRSAIKDIAIYGYFDTTPQSPIRKPMLPSGISSRLLSNGGNLSQILNKIKINRKSDFNKIIEALQNINPKFNSLDFNMIGTNIELMLEETNFDRSIHVTHISDGTLRYLCLLAIVHNPERGNLVCIDEPEIGLHPDMISEFVEAMNQVSDKTQFIISTHSEHILNNLSVENVLVCEKDDDNGTIVNTFRNKDYVEWASQYATGNLWRNGDLGGNRY